MLLAALQWLLQLRIDNILVFVGLFNRKGKSFFFLIGVLKGESILLSCPPSGFNWGVQTPRLLANARRPDIFAHFYFLEFSPAQISPLFDFFASNFECFQVISVFLLRESLLCIAGA